MLMSSRKDSTRDDPSLVIRADASIGRGTGHVMRMLALAQAWRRAGGTATFLGRFVKSVEQRLEVEGFEHSSIPAQHPDARDLEATLALLDDLSEPSPVWVAADGYHFDQAFQRAIRAAGAQLLVVDDLVHQDRYIADLFVNQNIRAKELQYEFAPHTTAFLGTRYAMLREEFLVPRRSERESTNGELGLLVTLGGADSGGAVLRVLDGLADEPMPGVSTKVVVGGASPHISEVEDRGQELEQLEVIVDTHEMPGLMEWADLAIAAGGSTSWELCHRGVPMILMRTAGNQRLICAGLSDAGAAVNLGPATTVQPKQIVQAVNRLSSDPGTLERMANCARTIVDGLGADRIVSRMRKIGGDLS